MYALATNTSSLAGIGAYPEGINQNPVFYTYLFDANWLTSSSAPPSSALPPGPQAVSAYLSRYAIERYSLTPSSSRHSPTLLTTTLIPIAQEAWRLLGATVYSDHQGRD